ncbi:MAG: PilZ domain-containing protein [Nitrospirota bacterium]
MEDGKRRKNRKLAFQNTEYVIVSPGSQRPCNGIVMDANEFGLCLLTASQLRVGQSVIIKNTPIGTDIPAVVRWSHKYDEICYKNGLEFTSDREITLSKEHRMHERIRIRNQDVVCRMAIADCIKILDMSLSGISLETDRRLDINREYTFHLHHGGRVLPVKGNIVWSTLIAGPGDKKGNTTTYRVGIKLTSIPDSMQNVIDSLSQNKGREEPKEYFSLSLDELGIQGEEKEYLETALSLLMKSHT